MYRPVLVVIIAIILGGIVSAQTSSVEAGFQKNKSKYKLEHFAEGEDASSGFDYLFYTSRGKVVKLRSIWSASHSNELRIDDYYFDNGVVLLRRFTGRKRNLSLLVRGREMPLTSREELHFSDGRLTRWILNAKAIQNDDSRWSETERSGIESAKSQLENYQSLKQND